MPILTRRWRTSLNEMVNDLKSSQCSKCCGGLLDMRSRFKSQVRHLQRNEIQKKNISSGTVDFWQKQRVNKIAMEN